MNEPTTRAEAAAAAEQLHAAEATIADYATMGPAPIVTLEATGPEPFLSLATRRVLYIVGLAALVVAPTVGVNLPEYAEAITTAGNLLGAAALGTALANPTR